ncbi:hypothetical protein ABID59_005645 [Bradyrhizobium sp. S3.3.6]
MFGEPAMACRSFDTGFQAISLAMQRLDDRLVSIGVHDSQCRG